MTEPKSFKSLMLALETARWRLATIWFSGSALIVIVLILQSLFDVYGGHVQEVWGWALPNFAPTLSLMMGVFAASALAQDAPTDTMEVRAPFYRLAAGLSVFHLLCMLLVIGVQPLLPARTVGDGPPDIMRGFVVSNLFLGPLQGLVAAALGALFFSKSIQKTPAEGANETQPKPPLQPADLGAV